MSSLNVAGNKFQSCIMHASGNDPVLTRDAEKVECFLTLLQNSTSAFVTIIVLL